MSRAEPISDILRASEGLELDEFLARWSHPFLVREATRASGEWHNPLLASGAAEGDKRTARVTSASVPVGGGFDGEVWVYRVTPADARHPDRPVVIGRGTGCDVVVDETSISTRHVEIRSQVDEDEGEREYLVVDLGSSNGTFLDGERLPAGTPRPIGDSMSLRLGPAVKMQFFSAPAFHLFLSYFRQIQPKEPS